MNTAPRRTLPSTTALRLGLSPSPFLIAILSSGPSVSIYQRPSMDQTGPTNEQKWIQSLLSSISDHLTPTRWKWGNERNIQFPLQREITFFMCLECFKKLCIFLWQGSTRTKHKPFYFGKLIVVKLFLSSWSETLNGNLVLLIRKRLQFKLPIPCPQRWKILSYGIHWKRRI